MTKTTANTQPQTVSVAMTNEQMLAEIARLQAENSKLTKDTTLKGGLKVSEKGALSVYGVGRFPVTLYKSQWATLLAKHDEIKAFIAANDSLLKEKGDAAPKK